MNWVKEEVKYTALARVCRSTIWKESEDCLIELYRRISIVDCLEEELIYKAFV